MPPVLPIPASKLCESCRSTRALISRPKTHQKLCKPCFLSTFESEIHATIVSTNLFTKGSRVAIGASGGKDSTVLASVLKTLNERYDYGVEFVLLSIDEGIKGYRDDSLETVKRNAVQYGMELVIVSYEELYGWSMDSVVETIGKKGNCTYCGVFRRQALDRGAERLGIHHVVTGHNADDIAETVLMNLLRGDLPRLHRCTSIITSSTSSPIARSKPLKYAYEKEIVLYALHKKLDYFSTECIYSPEAFRGSARTLIKALEKVRPSAILDIVRSGEAFSRMIPSQAQALGPKSPQGSGVEADIGGDDAGCNNGGAGRSSGGEMGDMEKALIAEISGLETLIPPASITPGKLKKTKQTPRKTREQRMSNCTRCGYLASQKLCKACTLLEGLNKNRPKTVVEVEAGIEDEEASSSLRRGIEAMKLAEEGIAN
ncbi:putative PP-loop ATPase superfamily protein [Tuber brumale]|nr:putative PP-loop ATPase superfamily protein [Tuber brumale]